MPINKQREILELRKLYLIQFEKLETKILILWSAIILLPLFVLWVQNKIDSRLVLVLALFTCVLDLVLQFWRKKCFNKLIRELRENNLGEI